MSTTSFVRRSPNSRRREHGTRAAYVFGVEPGGDRRNGCRCEPCTRANREYQRARDRAARRPDEELPAAFIDATEVRTHLCWLGIQGVGLRTVADRSRVSRSALAKLRNGSVRRCTPAVADRVLAVGLHRAAAGCLLDATRTWELIDDLLVHGHTRTEIARMLGSRARNPALQLRRTRVSAANAAKIEEVYRTLMADVLARRERDRDAQRAHRARSATTAPS
jgi:hypothetical protein